MACELCFKLFDEWQVRSGIAQEDGRHPTEASYVGNGRVPYCKVQDRSRQRDGCLVVIEKVVWYGALSIRYIKKTKHGGR